MKKDKAGKIFFSDDQRFADVFNGLVFGGRQIVQPQDLKDVDSEIGNVRTEPIVRLDHSGSTKRRDLVRKTAFGVNFAILGLENQEEMDYGLPLRNMSYECGEYERQAAAIRRAVRKQEKKDETRRLPGEYLYGFRKDSRLQPAITLILYYGERWDGPRNLYDMLDFRDIPGEMKQYIHNYSMNLIEVRHLEDLTMFHTDVQQVFAFLRYAKDKKKLRQLVETDDYYRHMDVDAYEMITQYAKISGVDKEHFMTEGGMNMCEAIEEMIEDGRIEGRAEGRLEGRAEGRAESILELLQELGEIPEQTREQILRETDREKLRRWLKAAAKAGSVEEFCENAGI